MLWEQERWSHTLGEASDGALGTVETGGGGGLL